MSNSGWDVLDRAHTLLREAVAGVPSDGWDLPTPCDRWTVAQVFQHATGDQRAYAGVLTGEGFPSEDPFSPSGSLSDSPAELLEPALVASSAAFAGVSPDAEQVAVPVPPGQLPAWAAAGACALDAAVHSWDIAVATGQPSPLDAELARELKKAAVEFAEPLRGFAWSAALPGDPSDDAVADLLKYLGRNPEWTASA